jgi:adenylyltransferase/sulfurtransferase
MATSDMFTSNEFHRYSRQILLPGFGREGQEKLKKSKVLVIGAGGLGAPILLYLAAAGVGTIGILDFDVVDESNLQRQVLFTTADIGKLKAELAAQKIKALNPTITTHVFNVYLSSANAIEIFSGYDLIADGSDNLPTRYLVNDACTLLNKPLIYGAIFQFEGQVSVFNELMKGGSRGPTYRDLFPYPPPPEMVPSCSEGGVIGVLPGIIGSMMANETIKVITGIGSSLSGRLLLFDALDFTTRFLKISINPNKDEIKTLINYEAFCNPMHEKSIQEIEPVEATSLLNEKVVQLIDVREPYEFNAANIGGINIPLKALEQQLDLISKSKTTLVVCRSGGRSRQATHKLLSLGYTSVINLKGGLMKWKTDVDPDLYVI